MFAARLSLALTFVSSSLLAQALPTSRSTAFSVGAGIELAAVRDNTEWTPGLSLQASYWFPRTTAHLQFRGTASYITRSRELGSAYLTRFDALGLSAELTAFPARSGTGLYGIAGLGVFRLISDQSSQAGTLAYHNTSGAMIGGLGFLRHFGAAAGFVEVRVAGFTNGDHITWGQAPLTFGVRF